MEYIKSQNLPDPFQTEQAEGYLNKLRELTVGSGSTIFRTTKDGSWWGSPIKSDAPAQINMDGSAVFTSITINGLSGETIASAINASGNFVNDIINDRFNTQTKQILGQFTFGSSGAIAIAEDSNNGIWLSPTGILAKKAGNTTFAIDTEGNATFAGNLIAASGTLGTITGGTITGATVQTATSGYRAVMTNSNGFQLYQDTSWRGTLKCDSSGSMILHSYDNIYLFGDNKQLAFFKQSAVELPAGYKITWNSGRYFEDQSSQIYCYGDFAASGAVRADYYKARVGTTVYDGTTDDFVVVEAIDQQRTTISGTDVVYNIRVGKRRLYFKGGIFHYAGAGWWEDAQ